MADDRRSHERRAVAKKVVVTAGEQVIRGISEDLSAGGAAIAASANVSLGARVRIGIEGLGEVSGHVVRQGSSLAVAFDVSGDEQEMLAAEILHLVKGAMPV